MIPSLERATDINMTKMEAGELYNETIDELETIFDNNISFSDNLNMQIVVVSVDAGEVINISHKLKRTPKYRIILGQSGSGSISDVKPWNDKTIRLRNNGVGMLLTVGIIGD